MQFPQPTALARTQGMADSAVDAAWTVMLPGLGLENRRLPPVVIGAHRCGEMVRAEIRGSCGKRQVLQ